MSRAVWVEPGQPLPSPHEATPEGLVAVGLDLSVERLEEAYGMGMFPWFNQGDPVLWWSPDPRMVLACADFKVSRSLGKKLRQIAIQEQSPDAGIRITTDMAFTDVMAACAGPRDGSSGTWIVDPIRQVYAAWHRAGRAHSVETWMDGQLCGGLYGVCLGRMFFGESMFSHASDASKIALAYLVAYLRQHGVDYIDCQQQTGHLASLGAAPQPRQDFLSLLEHATTQEGFPWERGQLLSDGRLAMPACLTP